MALVFVVDHVAASEKAEPGRVQFDVAGPTGEATLSFPLESLDAVIAGLAVVRNAARADGVSEDGRVPAKVPKSVAVSCPPENPTNVFVVFDMSLPTRSGYLLPPAAARNMAKRLTQSAREGEQARTRAQSKPRG